MPIATTRNQRGSLNLELALVVSLMVLVAIGGATFVASGVSNKYVVGGDRVNEAGADIETALMVRLADYGVSTDDSISGFTCKPFSGALTAGTEIPYGIRSCLAIAPTTDVLFLRKSPDNSFTVDATSLYASTVDVYVPMGNSATDLIFYVRDSSGNTALLTTDAQPVAGDFSNLKKITVQPANQWQRLTVVDGRINRAGTYEMLGVADLRTLSGGAMTTFYVSGIRLQK